MLYFWSCFTLTQSVVDHAPMSRVQLRRDYALLGGALWAKIWWLEAHKNFEDRVADFRMENSESWEGLSGKFGKFIRKIRKVEP